MASQSDFRAWTNSGDTPAGAQNYTSAEFVYTDPTNGVYQFDWFRRGRHDPKVLKFDGTIRLYQLEFVGATNNLPPKLFMQGIEGLRPEQ